MIENDDYSLILPILVDTKIATLSRASKHSICSTVDSMVAYDNRNSYFVRSTTGNVEMLDKYNDADCSTVDISLSEWSRSSGSIYPDKEDGRHIKSFVGRCFYPRDIENGRPNEKAALRDKTQAYEGDTRNSRSFGSSNGYERNASRNRIPTERFMRVCEMYEIGKKKITVDRERYKMKQDEKAKLAKSSNLLPKINRKSNLVDSHSRGPSERYKRLCELHEAGKRKIILDRERNNNDQKSSDIESKCCTTKRGNSNKRYNRLYALSKQKQVLGKARRDEVEKGDKSKTLSRSITNFSSVRDFRPRTNSSYCMSNLVDSLSRSPSGRYKRICELYEAGKSKIMVDRERGNKKQKDSAVELRFCSTKRGNINKRCNRLYALSRHKQVLGKERRDEVEKVNKANIVGKPITKFNSVKAF